MIVICEVEFDSINFLFIVLQEMDETEKKLKAELDNMKQQVSDGWDEMKANSKAGFDADAEASRSALLDELEEKKKQLVR